VLDNHANEILAARGGLPDCLGDRLLQFQLSDLLTVFRPHPCQHDNSPRALWNILLLMPFLCQFKNKMAALFAMGVAELRQSA
jgi:hypothetical protein